MIFSGAIQPPFEVESNAVILRAYRGIIMKVRTMAWTLMMLGVPALCNAETVAIFAPNLDFKDGAERNAYVTKIAKSLSDATGLDWNAQAFARAADFESARSRIDVAILDADYYSSKGGALKPVGMLSASGQTSRAFKVITQRGASSKLYDYRGKRLAIVANTSMANAFVTASALGNEVKAKDYFGSVDEVRDVRSAINAIEVGKADISLVYDGYDGGFTTVYTSPAVGLPIVALNPSRLSGEKADRVKSALLNTKVRASSFITGIAPYNSGDAGSYRRVAMTRKTTSLSYMPIEPDVAKVEFQTAEFKERSEGIYFNPFQVQYVPTLESFDKKLDRKL